MGPSTTRRSVAALLLASLAGAAAASEPASSAASPLTGVTWRLVGFRGGHLHLSLLADAGISEYEPEPAP